MASAPQNGFGQSISVTHVLDLAAAALVGLVIASGLLMSAAQRRYLRLYREVHGVELLGGARVASSPWLYVAEYRGMMRSLSNAYDTVQANPDLERLRLSVRRRQRLMVSGFVLLVALVITRLAGVA